MNDYTEWSNHALVAELEQLAGTYAVGKYVDGRALDAIKKEIIKRMQNTVD